MFAMAVTNVPATAGLDNTREVAMVRRLGRPVVVTVTRERGGWVAEVAALGLVRKGRSLRTLDRRVREFLGTGDVDYHFYTGDAELDRLVMQVHAAKAAADRDEDRARRLILTALLLPSGGAGRGLAGLPGPA